MAFTFADVFGGLRDNLTKLEGALTALIGLQAVVGSMVNGIPQVAKYVDGAFAALVVVSLFVKNLLVNVGGGSTPLPVPAVVTPVAP